MNKKALRQKYLTQLNELTSMEKQTYEQALQQNILTTAAWQQAQVIGLTLSKGSEWETRTLIEAAWQAGQQVAVPKCIPKTKRLDFYRITSYDQVAVGFYQLEEPLPERAQLLASDQIDLLVVPGVAFDKRGYRVGFGGGYYDRLLADFRGNTLSQFASWQWLEAFEPDPWDQPVDVLVTEKGVYHPPLI